MAKEINTVQSDDIVTLILQYQLTKIWTIIATIQPLSPTEKRCYSITSDPYNFCGLWHDNNDNEDDDKMTFCKKKKIKCVKCVKCVTMMMPMMMINEFLNGTTCNPLTK